MAVDGLKRPFVGIVWARCGHGWYTYGQGYPDHEVPLELSGSLLLGVAGRIRRRLQ